jgi:aminopeptidase YwaD
MAHLEALAVAIGPRPSGSPANAAAAAHIAGHFAASGLAVEEQAYEAPAWEDGGSRLTIAGRSLPCVTNPFSPPADVAGPAVAVGTLAELEAAELVGRVAVLYGELVKGPLAVKGFPYKGEAESRLVELLEAKRPAGLVTIQPRLAELERLVEDWELDIPSVTVPAAAGLTLLRTGAAQVALRIHSQRAAGRAANVVGRRPGERRERIVLMAHFDTKVDTPGASDNGGGVAALLSLAESATALASPFGLEFIAFNNEEYLPLGDDEYLRRAEGYFGEIRAAINFDGIGPALGANNVTAMAEDQTFAAAVRVAAGAFPAVEWVEPWPESNHSTFAWRGIPSVAMSNHAVAHLAHLRTDTVEWISEAKLAEAIALARAILGELTR